MNYTEEIEKVKQELMKLGFTEEKFQELVNLAAEEALDTALIDLREKDPSALEQLQQNLDEKIDSVDTANKNIDLIFNSAYGEQAENMKSQLIYEYIQTTLEETKQAKDLFDRYQAGDPTAISTINSNKDNPDIQNMMNQEQ